MVPLYAVLRVFADVLLTHTEASFSDVSPHDAFLMWSSACPLLHFGGAEA